MKTVEPTRVVVKKRVSSVDEAIAEMGNRFNAEACKDWEARFCWKVSGDDAKTFTVHVDHGKFEVLPKEDPDAEVQVETDSDSYLKLVNGDMKGVIAVMTRKLRVRGKLSYLAKMDRVFD